jgi:hypothetical protein
MRPFEIVLIETQHVAIHIKNERLNLSIAEGSSGRGRLCVSCLPEVNMY